jgi:hypothetical protein
MFEFCWDGLILVDDLLRVHRTKLIASGTADSVRQPRIGIYQGGFDLACRRVIEAMTVNDVGDIEASRANLVNAFQFLARVVTVDFGANVGEDAVALPFANVERLAVSRVDEAIDVGLQLLDDLGWKRLSVICVFEMSSACKPARARRCFSPASVILVPPSLNMASWSRPFSCESPSSVMAVPVKSKRVRRRRSLSGTI